MRIIDCEQRTAEWFDWHIGRPTGSHAADLLDFTLKGVEGSKRRLYRLQKAAELLTGQYAEDRYVSPEMQWGVDQENEARQAYSLHEEVLVESVGFVLSDDERYGCSPDGLIGAKGVLELKCPKTTTHLQWALDGKIPDSHLPQCRFYLATMPPVQWVDFASFDPRMSGRHKSKALMIIRLMREDAEVPAMLAAIDCFLSDVDETVRRLNEIAPPEQLAEVPEEDYGDLGITEADMDAVFGKRS